MNPKKPKITPEQLSIFTAPVTDIYRILEDEVFQMIAKRLKTSKDITKDTVFEWQVDKMNQLRMVNNDTIKALSKTTGVAEKEIRNAIKETGVVTIESIDHELKDIYPPLPQPTHIDKVLETFVAGTFKEFDNYINQSLIDTNYGKGTVSTMYRKIIEQTTAKVLVGTKTVNQAVTETIVEWSNKGLKTGFVDKGGHTWNLERYAEGAIRTTVNNVYNDLRMERMEEYGLDLVLVSSLPDPRDACSHIQGKVATLKEPAENDTGYPSIYEFGYGEPWGLRGISCRHMFFPYIAGLNENNQIQYSKEEMDKNRELRQKHRYYERQIRKAKQSLRIAETTGDEVSILRYKKLVRNRQASMRNFINESGRTRQYTRERGIS